MTEARVRPARTEPAEQDSVPRTAEPVCGNPFTRRTAALRQALVDAVSEEDIAEIARAMVEKARGGDTAAARLVLSYAVGKPAAPAEPDTLDRQELTTLAHNHVGVEEANRMAQRIPVDVMLNFFRPLLPILAECKAQQMVKDWHTAAALHDEKLKEEQEEDQQQAEAAMQCESGRPAAPTSSRADAELRETLRIWEQETEDVKKKLRIKSGAGSANADVGATPDDEECGTEQPLTPIRNRLHGRTGAQEFHLPQPPPTKHGSNGRASRHDAD